MRKLLLLFVLVAFGLNTFASLPVATSTEPTTKALNITNAKEFLSLTPKKYFEMTGKRMTLAQKIELKVAQKMVKKQMAADEPQITKGLYVVLAILGFGWLAMGLLDNFKGSDWIISLVLYALFYIPGLIYSLVKMKKYYN